MNTSMRQTQRTDLWVPRGRGWRGKDWEFQVSRCELLHRGEINDKLPLSSTGNHIQHPMINHHGKQYEKEYICIAESLCCGAEINTAL